jgi:hypothetical protein
MSNAAIKASSDKQAVANGTTITFTKSDKKALSSNVSQYTQITVTAVNPDDVKITGKSFFIDATTEGNAKPVTPVAASPAVVSVAPAKTSTVYCGKKSNGSNVSKINVTTAGGRRKTRGKHSKKHGKRSKTHKKHGKRSKTHRKRHGKRSKRSMKHRK